MFPSVPTHPTHCWKFQKNSNKIRQSNKYPYGFISSQNKLGKAEKERKQKLSLCFVPIRHIIENSKKIANKFKKLKNTIMASFQSKIGWRRPRKRDNENYCSDQFLPTRHIFWKFQKNSNKIRKRNKYLYGFISIQNK